MKRFLILIILLCLSCAAQQSNMKTEVFSDQTYTYDGEFNPDVFMNWRVIDRKFIGEFTIVALLGNPDEAADVEVIEAGLMVVEDWVRLIGYRYFINNAEFRFLLNSETNNYDMEVIQGKEYEFTSESTTHR